MTKSPSSEIGEMLRFLFFIILLIYFKSILLGSSENKLNQAIYMFQGEGRGKKSETGAPW